MLAGAAVYDAVSSGRPYRSAMSHEGCRAVMAADAAGGGLGPELVRTVFAAVPAAHLPRPAGATGVARHAAP